MQASAVRPPGDIVSRWGPVAALVVAEVLISGIEMGVPLLTVALGFPLGWYVARERTPGQSAHARLSYALRAGALAAGVLFAIMLAVWAPSLHLGFQPGFDAAEWGLPLWLYTSQASFWGWMALMIVGMPTVQFMAVATAAAVRVTVPASPHKVS